MHESAGDGLNLEVAGGAGKHRIGSAAAWLTIKNALNARTSRIPISFNAASTVRHCRQFR